VQLSTSKTVCVNLYNSQFNIVYESAAVGTGAVLFAGNSNCEDELVSTAVSSRVSETKKSCAKLE